MRFGLCVAIFTARVVIHNISYMEWTVVVLPVYGVLVALWMNMSNDNKGIGFHQWCHQQNKRAKHRIHPYFLSHF